MADVTRNHLCSACGSEIPADAPAGQCPQCLLKAGFESEGPASGAAGFEPPSVAGLRHLFPELEVLELVGQGGMGAVYKARQANLDRLVAIKVLPREAGRDLAFADRFTREARALARLSHPNIVAIYDFGQKEGLFYFVMEYVDGANLRQTLQTGQLQPAEALAIVPQICDALQFAHDEGIVHRDIKPENVLIDRRGRVKIADFGLARLLGEEQIEATLTHTNQVMGTLRYMAPEQMQDTHDVDHRADIYSLGVVFYELLTGDLPMGRFDPPSSKVQIDVRLDEVVLRALAQEPDKRYQRAGDVKTDVETLARQPAMASEPMPQLNETLATDFDIETTRREVNIPAMGLMCVGVLTCLMAAMSTLVVGKSFGRLHARVSQPAIAQYDTSSPVAIVPEADPHDSPAESTAQRPDWAPPAAASDQSMSGSFVGESDHSSSERMPTLAEMLLVVVSVATMLIWLTLGVIVTCGGWKMLHLESYSLAKTASIVALLPCQPLFILGLVFGIWSLIVLHRPDVKAAFTSVSETRRRPRATGGALSRRQVRRQLKGPGIGLMIGGGVNLLASLVLVLLPVFVRLLDLDRAGNMDFAEIAFIVAVGFVSLVLAVVMLIGAARMFDLEAYGIAAFAAVAGLWPVALGFPITLPFGIWALLVLSRREVREAFADRQTPPPKRDQHSKKSDSVIAGTLSVGLALGVAMGAALGNIPTFLILGVALGLLVGWGIDKNNGSQTND